MTIDWWTLGLQAANFAILVWLLRRFLYAPVRRVIAARQAETDAARAEAAEAKAAAEAEAEKLRAAQAALEAERQAILDQASAEAATAAKATAEQARAEAAAQFAKAKASIAAERQTAVETAGHELAALAAGLAGRILEAAAPSVAPGLFLDGLAEAVVALPQAERDRLAADMAQPGRAVTVVTAGPLTAKDQKAWSERLLPLLGGTAELTFAEDPALIGGAELRLEHSVLKLGWADRLAAAKEAMAHDGRH